MTAPGSGEIDEDVIHDERRDRAVAAWPALALPPLPLRETDDARSPAPYFEGAQAEGADAVDADLPDDPDLQDDSALLGVALTEE